MNERLRKLDRLAIELGFGFTITTLTSGYVEVTVGGEGGKSRLFELGYSGKDLCDWIEKEIRAYPKRCCDTCKHAEFDRTPTGRAKKGRMGRCSYPTEGIVELAIKGVAPSSVHRAYNGVPKHLPKGGVDPGFGTDCPVWEAKR